MREHAGDRPVTTVGLCLELGVVETTAELVQAPDRAGEAGPGRPSRRRFAGLLFRLGAGLEAPPSSTLPPSPSRFSVGLPVGSPSLPVSGFRPLRALSAFLGVTHSV